MRRTNLTLIISSPFRFRRDGSGSTGHGGRLNSTGGMKYTPDNIDNEATYGE
jgi:hypothetical protein